MEIIYKKIDDLMPYAMNQKEHPQEQIEKIANSLNQFGFKQPIVIDINNEIIVGHGRFEGAKKLNLQEVPCLIANDLSSAEIKAYRLADNKLNESDWNEDFVNLELQVLDDLNFNYSDLMEFNFDLEDEEIDDDFFEDDIKEDTDKIKLSVECANDTDKQQLKEELLSRGYICQ